METQYTTIIGMEVHVELKTESKMFCSCKNTPDSGEPNSSICEICTAQPGSLPVPNRKAVEWTVLIGRSLGCTIREISKFDRKHYFYPDLPKGYQISQYDEPIAEQGKIELSFPVEENIRPNAKIGIHRVHLEEDTAKLLHNNKKETLVDFNRAGTPLVEIVTDPDFKTAVEAKTYCQELQMIMRYLKVSDADMEKGHMRCEANVSVQKAGTFEIVDGIVRALGDHKLNNKVELKNINSFRAVERAIDYEIARQISLLEQKKTWEQQTRGWDEDKQETVLQRVKENAEDYRYFPEPDIPPFHPATMGAENPLPELPQARRARFHEEFGFSYANSKLLSADPRWADFTEQVMTEMVDWLYSLPEMKKETSDEIRENKKNKIARLAGGWLTSKLMGFMNERKIDIKILKIKPENFAELIALIYAERVNSTNAQKILIEMLDSGVDSDPSHIMEEKGYGQVSDEVTIENLVKEVIQNYPKQVEEFKSGKEPVLKFLVGMAMKATEGSADPKIVEKKLREKLQDLI
ncbi:MAG: Asp-tRNA(Asn)/Glu-tRNA(Gln) amidotransferase subunit GatB [Candidatus Magasanikbacteria bacterium]|nr:Asp-tRNA(Asn)/Glu-tRNA(Gln) amidotransferase subunit GatB [Candidatus Magasanikbacteria bacterium]